jgi:phosphoribosylformylglycinamidine synthase
MRAYLERVPLREASMRPHEILASESQERMLLIVTPENLKAVLAIADKWGVLATDIGEVTDTGRLIITWNGETVVDVPPGSLADDGPVYARPMREPSDLPLLQADRAETLERPRTGDELRATLLRMIASPNLCDKSFATEQYDRYVLGNSILAQPENSGMVRIDEESGIGVALALDGNSRYARLDPYDGAKLALAEAYRNVAVTGATPIAVTNCLNFGSPEDPAVMWQFAEAVRGLADGCAEMGIPVTGGNVSFYNQTGTVPINPTPVVGVLGIIDDVAKRVPMGFGSAGGTLFMLGDTHDELSGSQWAWSEHDHLGGRPPKVNFGGEQLLGAVIREASARGIISAAHDISDGGLAQVLVESCLRGGVGANVTLPEGMDPFVAMFSETTARAVACVPAGHEKDFTSMCAAAGQAVTPLGTVVADDDELEFAGLFTVSLSDLREAFSGTLETAFGRKLETNTAE